LELKLSVAAKPCQSQLLGVVHGGNALGFLLGFGECGQEQRRQNDNKRGEPPPAV